MRIVSEELFFNSVNNRDDRAIGLVVMPRESVYETVIENVFYWSRNWLKPCTLVQFLSGSMNLCLVIQYQTFFKSSSENFILAPSNLCTFSAEWFSFIWKCFFCFGLKPVLVVVFVTPTLRSGLMDDQLYKGFSPDIFIPLCVC